MHITNSIILITSAGSLLGGALAERFCELGAKLILVDQCAIGLKNTCQRCEIYSGQVECMLMHDYSTASIEAVFTHIDNKFQHSPDVLINLWPKPDIPSIIDEQPIEVFSSNISSIATTLFSFVQLCAQRMRNESKGGVVVNIIASTEPHNRKGMDHTASMVSGFTQSWAKELTPFNIRVGGILPNSSNEEEPMNELLDDVIRNTEYIVENEYFSGRTMSA
ncbi:SDR family oxidoreductase [Vibrio sp.]|nr:SDR family oxidoreductase [Vibrio sp.]